MRHHRIWYAVTGVLVLVGVSLSLLLANARVADERRREAAEFRTKSSDVAARVGSEVDHIEDLSRSAQAFVRRAPQVTSSQLQAWADDVEAFKRFPAVRNMAIVAVVDDSQLDEHLARVTADARVSGPSFEFELDPATPAAAYCLRLAGVGEGNPPIDRNLCPGMGEEQAAQLRSFADTQFIPSRSDGFDALAITVPLYASPGIPKTAAEREATFVAFVGLSFIPTQFLEEIVSHFRGYEARLEFHSLEPMDDDLIGAFGTGAVQGDANQRTFDVGSRWRVVVSEPRAPIGLLATGSARLTLLGGSTLTLLVAAVVFLLGSGRARARRLVVAKTEQLQHQALHDSLTGLANRALLMDRVEHLLARARRNGTEPSCLFLDLDGFKGVNDSLGHEAGDLLLQSVATRLLGALRGADTIARIGGDEFVVLLDGSTVDAAPDLVAQRLVDVLREPYDVEGVDTTMRVTASVGIATGLRPSGDDLIRDADFALYEAKGAGRNRIAVFREGMQSTQQQAAERELELRFALERGELRLVYQPIYNLDDLSVDGFEALLRWEHPELGLVMPEAFIPALERTGQIVEVGRWVLREACAQLARWRALGSDAMVSVNVAARQFDNGVLLDDVRDALEAAELDPAALTIEITETSLMRNLPVCVEQLVELRRLGVQVAIDDFGTGYSSLASLQRLPVDSLKIDRSFIAAMSEGSEAKALVHTIVQLGRDLGLRTLAEGVETAEQMANLRGDHITQAQGYLFAHPLEADEIETTLFGVVPSTQGVEGTH
jgi:diguanylate cyclase (GGDEF)-like protein